jgi:hypothetical protein
MVREALADHFDVVAEVIAEIENVENAFVDLERKLGQDSIGCAARSRRDAGAAVVEHLISRAIVQEERIEVVVVELKGGLDC